MEVAGSSLEAEFEQLDEIRESTEPVVSAGAPFETTQKQHSRVASTNLAKPKSFKFQECSEASPVPTPLTDEELAHQKEEFNQAFY